MEEQGFDLCVLDGWRKRPRHASGYGAIVFELLIKMRPGQEMQPAGRGAKIQQSPVYEYVDKPAYGIEACFRMKQNDPRFNFHSMLAKLLDRSPDIVSGGLTAPRPQCRRFVTLHTNERPSETRSGKRIYRTRP